MRFKEKMEQAKTKKGFTNNLNWMKFDAGKRYTLRFLPLKSEQLDLPISIFHHHAITFPDGHFESIACPRQTEDRFCPFCDLASKTWKKFTKTENVEYKEAAKALFAKKHFLLIGYEPNSVDSSNITSDDLKVVRASSQSVMQQIETKLEREIDFVDFATGRNVELLKTKATGKGAVTTITWEFGDPSSAFDGKSGKKVWDELIDKSPDLTSLITPLSEDALQIKFKEFTSTPVDSDEVDEETKAENEEHDLLRKYKPEVKNSKPASVVEDEVGGDLDFEEMRKAMED